MRDPLLDELAQIFDDLDPVPDISTPLQHNDFDLMALLLEPVRGPSQLAFHRDDVRMHLQLDPIPGGLRLLGLVRPGTTSVVSWPGGEHETRADDVGWFRADVPAGPLNVALPALRLKTGWFLG